MSSIASPIVAHHPCQTSPRPPSHVLTSIPPLSPSHNPSSHPTRLHLKPYPLQLTDQHSIHSASCFPSPFGIKNRRRKLTPPLPTIPRQRALFRSERDFRTLSSIRSLAFNPVYLLCLSLPLIAPSLSVVTQFWFLPSHSQPPISYPLPSSKLTQPIPKQPKNSNVPARPFLYLSLPPQKQNGVEEQTFPKRNTSPFRPTTVSPLSWSVISNSPSSTIFISS